MSAHLQRALIISKHCLQNMSRVMINLACCLTPIAWMEFKKFAVDNIAFFILFVEEWTVGFSAYFIMLLATRLRFVLKRVILKLFPAVTHAAAIFQLASVLESLSVFFRLPRGALRISILKCMRWTAEVLPVVSV